MKQAERSHTEAALQHVTSAEERLRMARGLYDGTPSGAVAARAMVKIAGALIDAAEQAIAAAEAAAVIEEENAALNAGDFAP